MKQIFVSDVLNVKKISKSLKKDLKKTESFSEILKNLKKLKYASGKITETESLSNAKTLKKAQVAKVPDVSKALKEKDVERVVSERKTSNQNLLELKDERNQRTVGIAEKEIKNRISVEIRKEVKAESSQSQGGDEVPKAEVFGKKKIVVSEKEDLKLRRKVSLDKASFKSVKNPLKSQLVKEIKEREISEKASFPKKENGSSEKVEKRDLNPRSKVKEESKKEDLARDIPQKEKVIKRASEDLQKNLADKTNARKKFSSVVQKKEMKRVHSSSGNNSKKDDTVKLERRINKRAEYKEAPSKDGGISKKDDKSEGNQEDSPMKDRIKDERVEKLKSSNFVSKEAAKKEKNSFEKYSKTFKKLSLDEPKKVLSEHVTSIAKEDKRSLKNEGKDSRKTEEDARVFEKKGSEFSKDLFSSKEKFSKMKATDEKPYESSPLMKVNNRKKVKERDYKFVRKNFDGPKTPDRELIRSVKSDGKKASIFEKSSPSKKITDVLSKLTHFKKGEESPLKDNVTAKDHQASRKKSEKPSRKAGTSNSRADEKLIFRKQKDVSREELLSKEKSNSGKSDSGNFFRGFSKGKIVGSDDIFRKKSADSKGLESTKKEKSPKVEKIEASKKSAGEIVLPGHEGISESQSENLIESHLEKILSRSISKKIDEKPLERKFIEKISKKAEKRIDISKSEIKNQISKVKSKIENKYSGSERSAVKEEEKTNVDVEKINNIENPILIPVSSQKSFQKDKLKLEEILRDTKNNVEISKDLKNQSEKSIDFKESEKRKEILENLKIEVTVSKKVKEVYQSYRYDHKKFKDIFRKVQQVKEEMNLIRFSEKTNFKDTQKISDVPSEKRVKVEEIIERISRILESKRSEPKLIEKARMDLDPPNLGKLEVEISKEDKNITLIFRVSSQYTKDLIERKLDTLVHRLSSDGFNIEKIEVRMEKSENHEEDLTDHQENRGQREKDENEKKEKREEGEEK